MNVYQVSTQTTTLFAKPSVAIAVASRILGSSPDWLRHSIELLQQVLEKRGEVTLRMGDKTCTVKRISIQE